MALFFDEGMLWGEDLAAFEVLRERSYVYREFNVLISFFRCTILTILILK